MDSSRAEKWARDKQSLRDALAKAKADLNEAEYKHRAALRLNAAECQGHLAELAKAREAVLQLQQIRHEVAALSGKARLEQTLKAAQEEARTRRLEYQEKVRALEKRCECCKKTQLLIMECLIDDAGLAPVLAAACKVDELNTAIAKVAFFLASNVQTMAHEIFQEEIERSYENCVRTIGSVLASFIYIRTQEGSAAAPDCFVVKVAAHAFINAFCLAYLNNCVVVNVMGEVVAYKSWQETIDNPPPRQDVKSKFLHGISDIFKVASWAILGTEKRDAFEATLNQLFSALEELNASGHILCGANIVLSMAQINRPFLNLPEMLSEVEFDHNDPQYVAGLLSFGVRKRLPSAAGVGGNAGRPEYRTIVSTEVVLYSTLKNKSGVEPPQANAYVAYPEDAEDSVPGEDVNMTIENADLTIPHVKVEQTI